jgi:hypothetical protein
MKKERTLDKTSRVFMALTTAALFVVTLFCTTGAIAQDKAPPAAKKPTAYREKAGTITATVQAIDLEKRIVKVKGGPRGEMVEIKADERVKNLSRLKVGDEVVVEYFASVAVWVKKPGDVKETMEKAQVEGPGSEVRQITVTATIQDIDKDRNNVFLRWPEGVIVGMQVKNPSILEGVKVGDQVVITYTEALAISIEKEKP